MKTFYKAVPWVLVVVLVAFHLFRTIKPGDTSKPENQVKEIRSDRDSLIQVIALHRDTLAAIRGVKESLEFQLTKARKETKQSIQQHENNKFVIYPDDSARYNDVAKLYPSMGWR